MHTYELKYVYFENRAPKYGYITIHTESTDEEEIVRLATIEAESEVMDKVKILQAREIF
jgi:hypothetical protein